VGELRTRLKVAFFFLVAVLVILVFFPANPSEQLQHLDQYLTLQFLGNTVVAALLHRVQADLLPAGWILIAAKGFGEGLEIYFIASLILAAAISMPVLAYETYKFVDPALKEEERRMLYPFVISTSVLFAVGLLFGYFILAKLLVLALAPFFVASGTQFVIDSASFYYVVFLIVGSSGASFTVPVFVYVLIRLRVIEASFFSRNRVVIWFVLWVVTGLFLSPDGGPLLDLVIFVPIVSLVEAAVWFGRRGVSDSPRPARQENRCKYCSARLEKGGLFCPDCGRALS